MLSRQRYLDTVTQEGGRLAVLARGDDLSVRVPSCPDWDLAALVGHTSSVHRYVTAWMEAGEPVGRDAVGAPGPDLAEWFTEGLDRLVDRLEGCDPDAEVSTFVGPGTNWFWLRRMAHENTVHRWDAEEALGMTSPVPVDVALDGVDEFLTSFHLPHRVGKHLAGDGETVHFHATDGEGEWVVTRTPEGASVERAHQRSDVAARGRAEDLLLFVWGRRGPEVLEVFGDESLLTLWQDRLNP